jgi:hypothetical protein
MKTKKTLEDLYLRSYDKHEGIFIIVVLAFCIVMIIIGLNIPL